MIATRILLAGALAASTFAFAAPAQAASDATVSVLHGVPGAVVDVYANGSALLTNFAPGTLTDPVKLPAGEYDLKVVAAGAGIAATSIMQADNVMVPAGANITIVAHLKEDGTPVLTPFVNDVSHVAAGKARLTVRHVAAAPLVDVRANGTVAFKGLANPKEVKADLAAGTISADVVVANTSTVVIGPANVTLAEGTNTIVYAWGSVSGQNLALAVQTITGLHSAPHGVPAGDGGQAAAADAATRTGFALLAALLVGGAVLVGLRRQATQRI